MVDAGTERVEQHVNTLLVGDGNLSFALALHRREGLGARLTASVLQPRCVDDATTQNALSLRQVGVRVEFGIDVTRPLSMHKLHPRVFDRIIFNFPLVSGSIQSAVRGGTSGQLVSDLLAGLRDSPILQAGVAHQFVCAHDIFWFVAYIHICLSGECSFEMLQTR